MSTTNSGISASTDPKQLPRVGRETFVNHDNPSAPAVAGGSTLPKESSTSTTSGMTCGSQLPAPVAVRVDQKDLISGKDSRTNKGDTAKASLFAAADNGGPRQSAGQYKGSKFETQPPFVGTANAEETGA